MMFEYSFQAPDISNIIRKSVENVLKSGTVTKDISQSKDYATTSEMGSKILEEIKNNV